MKNNYGNLLITLLSLSFFLMVPMGASAQTNEVLKTYPETFKNKPGLASPFVTKEGKEMIVALLRNSKQYTLIPVTMENGRPLLYSRRIKSLFGKDRQLRVDSGDFPELARTGLHSESILESKKMITGVAVDVINYIGRPGRFSYAGFLADDEDILSVLKADNRLVKQLGLTHPQMAKPLFHVWNIILKEIELGKLRRFSNIQHFFYNGGEVGMKAQGTKGWQVSIFQDEIQGRFDISIHRQLNQKETALLKGWYPHLSSRQMTDLEKKFSSIHFSEMAPYYIMRYGFYEGHTTYRADPIAISFIFGLRSIVEIEGAFKGKLYITLTSHFSDK